MNTTQDLANLVKSQGWAWPDVVVGHSMGGKVALHFAESCARGDYGDFIALPKQLWVLDSVPGEVKSENSDVEVEKVLRTLLVLPSKIPSRKWLVDHMIELGFSKSLSEWIDSNIKKSGDHETWPFNLDGAVLMFNSYGERSYWSLLEHPPKDMEKLLFVPRTATDGTQTVQRLESTAKQKAEGSNGNVAVHVLQKGRTLGSCGQSQGSC